jgi:hypothetical protein
MFEVVAGESVTRAGSWFQTLWDVLQDDDEACLGLIRSAGGHDSAVELVEGTTSAGDALAYARTLAELGHGQEAWEIFNAVVRAAFSWWSSEAAVA